jgi:hypothetical protein
LAGEKLMMPTLLLGSEVSGAQEEAMEQLFANGTANAVADAVPKAGHWLGRTPHMDVVVVAVVTDERAGEEKPEWTANRVLKFFAESSGVPSVDLAFLKYRRSSLGVIGGY